MNAPQAIRLARAGSAALSLAVLIAGGCGPQQEESFSSTLEAPAKPGDGYRLVRTTNDRYPITRIGVGGNSLFFEVPWQGLYEMPKYGGPVTAVDRDSKAMFYGLATSGSELLWLKSHFDSRDYPDAFLLRRRTEGGPTAVLRHGDLDTALVNNLSPLTADSSHVYLQTENSLEVIPIGGGVTERVAEPLYWSGEQRPGFVSFAGDYPMVYLTICETVPTDCALKSVDLSTGAWQVLGPASIDAHIVGLDAGSVYMLEGYRLWSIDRANGSETELIGAAAGIYPGLPAVLDGQNLYFMGKDPGAQTLPAQRLMTIPKSGGAITILGSDSRINAYQPWDLAVDDQFAFVLTSPTGGSGVEALNEILAFPKTPPPAP